VHYRFPVHEGPHHSPGARVITSVHVTPWKVAMVYSLLAVAESLGATVGGNPSPQRHQQPPPRRSGDTDKIY
jgi:hypothetical protein